MSYYPIKCIQCLRSIREAERCVKLTKDEIKSDQFDGIRQSDSIQLNDGRKKSNGKNGFVLKEKHIEIQYKSLAQLRKESVITNEEVYPVSISPEYAMDEECRATDLVQAVEVKDLQIGEEKVSGIVRRFYCPYCHSQLIPQAGKMPIYLVSLMGPSSAGKTVYLTILHMLLSGGNIVLPQGYVHFETLGVTGKEYEQFASHIRRNNRLPATTQEDRKAPYLLQVDYTAIPGSAQSNKKCILGLIDMRGEMFNGEHNEDLSNINVPQFKESDGFIMMVDPETLEGVYNRLPEQYMNRDINQLEEAISAMKTSILDCVTGDIGQIQKPSVVALTKTDLLYKNHQQLGIPLNQPVIAPAFRVSPNSNLAATYFDPMSQSTRECIQYLSRGLSNFLEQTFFMPYYISVSALGAGVKVSGDNLDNYQLIHPIRVDEPLIYLLMKLNFVPSFYRGEFFEVPQRVVNEWGENFAECWDVEIPRAPKPAKSRSWFHKR